MFQIRTCHWRRKNEEEIVPYCLLWENTSELLFVSASCQFQFMLACSMLKGPDGVWKQWSRLGRRARNAALQGKLSIFSINWSTKLALITKHSLDN